MAPRPDETGGDGNEQEVIPVDERQFAELIDVQRELIAEQRERNAIVARALEIGREEIQLKYDYDSKRLKAEDEQNKRGYRLAQLIVGSFVIVPFLLLIMVFYGSEAQSGNAMKILTEGAKALGGAGFIFLIYGGLKRLLNR